MEELLDTDSILIQYLVKTQALEQLLLSKNIISAQELSDQYDKVEQELLAGVDKMLQNLEPTKEK